MQTFPFGASGDGTWHTSGDQESELFPFLEKAIEIEVERQIDVLEGGGRVVQETRLYDADRDETRSMRSKEEANDYRYFPDPDLLPITIAAKRIDQLRAQLPELPDVKRARFIEEYALTPYDADILAGSRALADFYDSVVSKTNASAKLAANWVTGELSAALNRNELEIGDSKIGPGALALLLDKIEDGTISGKIGKEIFDALWNGEGDVEQIIKDRGLEQISDTGAIEAMVAEVVAANAEQVEQYRAGKTQVLGFLVGQVMKASRGKANPQQVNEALRKVLQQ